ncbi:hypothetical protein [Indiicoccus explosivorum]|uniref:hypothetical protein n=1 Tax=Indiicoccus explosivorum TaxID=1917864 RepID=UPI000B45112B|nr:hypothetical protein [Indiicoccus explosivorum]
MNIGINPLAGLLAGLLAGQFSEPGELRAGQLLKGTVNKLFPGQTAEVAAGGKLLTAQLEVPLRAGENYLFHVTATEPEVRLKVAGGSQTSPAAALGLPDSKEVRELLDLLMSRNVPVKREMLLQAVKTLRQSPQVSPEMLKAAAVLIEQQVPVSPGILQSITADQPALGRDLMKLAEFIRHETPSSVPAKLADSVEKLVSPVFGHTTAGEGAAGAAEEPMDGKTARDAIRTVLRLLGANYEPQLLRGIPPEAEALKPQLVKLLHDPEVPVQLREQAEKIVSKLNTQAVFANDPSQASQQILMHLPLQFGNRQLDALLKWNGRMGKDGKIDPDYARVMFYLDLPALNETIIDMAVQNRVVSLTIFHSDPELAGRIRELEPSLKAGLASADYRLSSVTVKAPATAHKSGRQNRVYSQTGEGVDFRI